MGRAALAATAAALWSLVIGQVQGATLARFEPGSPGSRPTWTLHVGAGGCQNVPQRVRTIVAKHFRVDEAKVTDRTDFVADLKADELDQVELTMAVEEEFKIRLSDAESAAMRTVDDVAASVAKANGC